MAADNPDARRLALGAAIHRVFKEAGLTQDQLADRLEVSQGMVSRWKRGEVTPKLEEILAIEEACGAPRGRILRISPYVDEGASDALAAIENDPALSSDADRDLVAEVYRRLTSRTQPADGSDNDPALGVAGDELAAMAREQDQVMAQNADALRAQEESALEEAPEARPSRRRPRPHKQVG